MMDGHKSKWATALVRNEIKQTEEPARFREGSTMRHVSTRTIGLLGLALTGVLAVSSWLPASSYAQGPSVKVAENDTFGPFLTDANGMTLYTYIPDDGAGTSKCVDACATSWPPATIQGNVEAPAGLPKKLDVTTRADGS